MRIDRIVARAFGPFRDEELRLAPGMTVVGGPNEAGKSSWHAALRLALTGLRRGKGPGTVAERALVERHRPWDQDRWEVEARLQLADGRSIEIRQDLAGKVDCSAVDVGLGRDVSDEILDGTPDASRWLGLTRDSFASTVSVNQAQILAVAEAADQLQEQMQRAAATRGTDGTAAEAIGRLEAFRRDAVGVDRVGARGPLRAAKDRLAALEARLDEARRQHDEYLGRSADVEDVERRVDQAEVSVRRIEAGMAGTRAREARQRHELASTLSARYPDAPEAVAARDARADAVAAAIDGWTSRAEPVVLEGPDAAALERELRDLPDAPAGDLEPHPTVREALQALDQAEAALAVTEEADEADAHQLPAVDEMRVRELARRLRSPQTSGVLELQRELDEARHAATDSRSSGIPGVAVALISGIAGSALLLAGQGVPGVALLALALMAGAWAWQSGSAARVAAARVARAEAALAPYLEARRADEADRRAAIAEAAGLGLPAESSALDLLADRLASAAAARRALADRQQRRASLEARRAAAAAELLSSLADRGETATDDPRGGWTAYEAACRSRSEQARAAATREALTRQLASRRAAERAAAASAAAIASAERRLREAASAVSVEHGAEPELIIEQLRAWQHRRLEQLRENEAAIGDWQRLQALLDGVSLADLAKAAAVAEDEARAAAAVLPMGVAPAVGAVRELEVALARARADASEARGQRDALRGNLEARRESLPDVAEAEESVLAGRDELRRVEALAETLDRTITLLRSAEERVHRSLAPVLAASIERWLPTVCAGAYVDVTVDPANLAVRVKEAATGKWRDARLLSEGTREQIYLLLRVAMAEHLVTGGETAPLLLDEVTVQSDGARKRQLLDVLHELSGERQVILFTHDDDVLAWAAEQFTSARDAIVRLDARPSRERTASGRPALEVVPTPADGLASVPIGD